MTFARLVHESCKSPEHSWNSTWRREPCGVEASCLIAFLPALWRSWSRRPSIGFALDTLSRRSDLEHEYQRRALVIGQTFAAMPTIREALFRHDAADRREIQALAQQVRKQTGATYIVVINRDGVRFSHPNPALIGKRVAEPVVALDGRDHLGVDHGNLGISANAKVPLRAPDGQIIGEVSTGILEKRVSSQLLHEFPTLLLYFAISLGIGIVASLTPRAAPEAQHLRARAR